MGVAPSDGLAADIRRKLRFDFAEKFLENVGLTFGDELHIAIFQIANESAHVVTNGNLARTVAEPNPLNMTGKTDVNVATRFHRSV